MMLRLAIETVAHDYDVIVIDSAPNLVLVPSMLSVLRMYSSCQRQQSYSITPLPSVFDMQRDLLKNVDLQVLNLTSEILLTKYRITMAHSHLGWKNKSAMRGDSMVLKNVVTRDR